MIELVILVVVVVTRCSIFFCSSELGGNMFGCDTIIDPPIENQRVYITGYHYLTDGAGTSDIQFNFADGEVYKIWNEWQSGDASHRSVNVEFFAKNLTSVSAYGNCGGTEEIVTRLEIVTYPIAIPEYMDSLSTIEQNLVEGNQLKEYLGIAMANQTNILESFVESMQSYVSEMEARVSEMEASIRDLDSNIGELDSSLAELEGEVDENKEKIEELEMEMETEGQTDGTAGRRNWFKSIF